LRHLEGELPDYIGAAPIKGLGYFIQADHDPTAWKKLQNRPSRNFENPFPQGRGILVGGQPLNRKVAAPWVTIPAFSYQNYPDHEKENARNRMRRGLGPSFDI
jgi:hypothetical protein